MGYLCACCSYDQLSTPGARWCSALFISCIFLQQEDHSVRQTDSLSVVSNKQWFHAICAGFLSSFQSGLYSVRIMVKVSPTFIGFAWLNEKCLQQPSFPSTHCIIMICLWIACYWWEEYLKHYQMNITEHTGLTSSRDSVLVIILRGTEICLISIDAVFNVWTLLAFVSSADLLKWSLHSLSFSTSIEHVSSVTIEDVFIHHFPQWRADLFINLRNLRSWRCMKFRHVIHVHV